MLRLEPHVVISNRTGTPLQIMHHSPATRLQRLGNKATGVQPAQSQQPQRTPPGLKGVVANPQQDWTSCIDIPIGTSTTKLETYPCVYCCTLKWIKTCGVRPAQTKQSPLCYLWRALH